MNREEILKLEACEETDKLIADVIYNMVPCDNWKMWHAVLNEWTQIEECEHEHCYPRNCPPHYSRNMEAAWLLIKRVRPALNVFTRHACPVHGGETPEECFENCIELKFGSKDKAKWHDKNMWYHVSSGMCDDFGCDEHCAWDYSASLAICKAALLRHFVKEEQDVS